MSSTSLASKLSRIIIFLVFNYEERVFHLRQRRLQIQGALMEDVCPFQLSKKQLICQFDLSQNTNHKSD